MRSTLSLASHVVVVVVVVAASVVAATNARLAIRDNNNTPLSVSAGAHVIYSYSGAAVPPTLTNYVADGKVGGVILFGNNVANSTPAAVASLQSTWRHSPYYSGAPLLILTDQEGGEVRRLPGGPTDSEKEIGAAADPAHAAGMAGEQAAQALESYNNNGNLAPVCDVFRRADDFDDQFQRSYSSDPSVAGACAAAFVTAQQASSGASGGAGPVATLKHFPGLGAAASGQNTDAQPVTLNVSLEDLRAIDEPPFSQAIAAGAKIVMPSWAIYPAFDDAPAGLSAKWIRDELRGRLGFAGVTISDAIEAGALSAYGDDAGRRAVLATVAGVDLILAAGGDPEQGSGVVDALVAAVGGAVDAEDFAASSRRIAELRAGLLA